MKAYIEKSSITITLIPTIQLFKWHSYRIKNHVTKKYHTLEIKLLFLKYTLILEISGEPRA